MNADCTILILTYKAKHHLELLLPTVKDTLANTTECECDVLIVDNGSSEENKKWVELEYPEYRYEFSPVNDYLFSLNRFVENCKSEYVLILNDDMRLHPEVINRSMHLIRTNQNLFAVNCKIRDWDDTYTATGVRELKTSKGWLSSTYIQWDSNDPVTTLYGGGGAALFRTELFNNLGGFDPLFRPAYCEDLALGYYAWSQGYEVIYCPEAILYHREGGTIGDQFKQDKLERMINANRILWMVAYNKTPGFLLWFFIKWPWRVLVSLSNKNMFYAWWKALVKLPKAISRRKRIFAYQLVDGDIAKMIGKRYEF